MGKKDHDEKLKKLDSIYSELSEREKILFELFAFTALLKFGKDEGFQVTKSRGTDLEGNWKTIYTIEVEEI